MSSLKKWLIAAGIGLGIGFGLWYYYNRQTPRTSPEIKIASFNIQTFGKTKCAKKEVMDTLAKTIRNFDLIAIQEIKDETILPSFLEKINESGNAYRYIASEKLGRTISKEQYGFFYADTIHYGGKSYVYNDGTDAFEREPFVAQFKAKNFDFILVNIHTKPTDAKKEIASLVDVVREVCNQFSDDKDVIVLGDFNADGSYFSEKTTTGLREDFFFWAIPDAWDTTVAESSNTYDRIVFQKQYTGEDFTGKSGVFRFDEAYGLSKEAAKQVSDHYPVWSKFYTERDSD